MSLYLPEDMKQRVAEAARVHQVSEAEYMRDAIERMLSQETFARRSENRPQPRLPLFDSGDPGLARRTDEILEDFDADGRA